MPAGTLGLSDERWMLRALELAARARGRTSPNPMVGAVLVREGEVVAEGFHARAGAPHAEAVALGQAGESARGATLYVTLEPCAHSGRTPPCAPAVAAAGVTRVVAGPEDPDPRVRGEGFRVLREAGVEVEAGFLGQAAARLNEAYFWRVRTGRALGVLKAAVTLDGRLGADGGDSRWITGEEARFVAHELRDTHDAVVIGRGTLDRDDPSLDVRLGGERRNPVVVVLDSRLSGARDRRLWERARGGAAVLVAAAPGASAARRAELERAGVEVVGVEADGSGRVSIPALFEELARRGFNSALVEGGEAVHTACLRAGVIGRAYVFVAPRILGGAEGPRLAGDLGHRRVADALRLTEVEHRVLGEDVLVSGRTAPAQEEA